MNTESQAADQVVSMSLRGMEEVLKLTGVGAKNLATYLYAVLNSKERTKGKTRLKTMLKSGKELRVFAIKKEDLATFQKEAKRYGVLYCALRDKNNTDGYIDVMVKVEDAPKINRIMDRFELASIDTASIKQDIEISKEKNLTQEEKLEKTANKIMGIEDPKKSLNHENKSPSENNSKTSRVKDSTITSRPSIKKQLENIKQAKVKSLKPKNPIKEKKRGR